MPRRLSASRRLSFNVGNRGRRAALRAPFAPGTYKTLLGMAVRLPRFRRALNAYLTAGGQYPWDCPVRTPAGIVRPTLYSSHDVSTVIEIFCREDYAAPRDVGVVVDIGSNIGISALYFLTRSPRARIYAYEPDPRNVERLERNLAQFRDRVEVNRLAVGLADGVVGFGTEPTGRYGRISDSYGEAIAVECRRIAAVIEDVLATEAQIDLLKIDVEGSEPELVAAIPHTALGRINTIYFEAVEPLALHDDLFEHAFAHQTNRLRRRSAPR